MPSSEFRVRVVSGHLNVPIRTLLTVVDVYMLLVQI